MKVLDTTQVAPRAGEPEDSYPRQDRRILGNPRRQTWEAVNTVLGDAKEISAGVWTCEPGRWQIAFGAAQQEVFTVLSGRCRVHAESGGYKEAGPGDALHIPAGFRGEFEVIEQVTKTYVTVDAKADAGPNRAKKAPGRWVRLLEAADELWKEYTWLTRGATLLLVLACVFGMYVTAGGDLSCALRQAPCWPSPAWVQALASDAFRTLITLLIALLVAIHLKERMLEGKLDGSQHYDVGRALAYGYFRNFLVPALLIARDEKQVLHVIRPGNVEDLEKFVKETWPAIRSRTSTLSTDKAYEANQSAPLKRSILVLTSLSGKDGEQRELFDFPSTLFTVHDYYETWNEWLDKEGKALIKPGRLRELQERQIKAFFEHLRELSRTDIGERAVADLGFKEGDHKLRELFEERFRTISPDELSRRLGASAT